MDEPLPNPRAQVLQAFRDALARNCPLPATCLSELIQQGLLEEALLELKRARPRMPGEDPWASLRRLVETEVSRSRERRMLKWQLDPGRRTIRLRMEVRRPACTLHPPALQAALAHALSEAGVPVAMGLEKTPRPMVRLGHPLPQGIEGLSEWAEVILREPMPMAISTEIIRGHCPDGLKILQMEGVPNHASPVLDLCRKAHWIWRCPSELVTVAMDRLDRFGKAESYEIEKTGKVDGRKQVKRLEVRPLVLQMSWEGDAFLFTTRLSAAEALNPVKLLAGILDMEPSKIEGLTRLSVELAEDPRLAMAEKYEPKLHNIFEDAVLLDSGGNVRIVEEDDDEPILLRKEEP